MGSIVLALHGNILILLKIQYDRQYLRRICTTATRIPEVVEMFSSASPYARFAFTVLRNRYHEYISYFNSFILYMPAFAINRECLPVFLSECWCFFFPDKIIAVVSSAAHDVRVAGTGVEALLCACAVRRELHGRLCAWAEINYIL